MKEITYFSLRLISILLFGYGLLLLEELYHGIRATYFETDELIRMTFPTMVYLFFSILLWFSARKVTRIISNPKINQFEGINSDDLKGVIIHIVGVLYLITTIPDFVLFVAQSLVYIDFMGLGYMSKVDTVLFLVHFLIGLIMVKKTNLIVKIINKFIKPM